MMEGLLAQMEARMKADRAEMMAEMKVIQHKWDATLHERNAHHEEMMAKMDAWRGVTRAFLEKVSTPEETEAVAKPQDVPEGATIPGYITRARVAELVS
jgi:hypothetical protein